MARLVRAIIFTRNLELSVSFYSNLLGLKVSEFSKSQAELKDKEGMGLLLKLAPSEAFCSPGYMPMLQFEVSNVAFLEHKAKDFNCTLDGPITTTPAGKVLCMRGPDGNMLGLLETEKEPEEEQETPKEEDFTDQEMKKLLSRLKI